MNEPAPRRRRRAEHGEPTGAPPSLTAYVLHRYDWSESSLILDLFTREQGRIAVAAKGAKRPFSQLRSVLLPFQRLQRRARPAAPRATTRRGPHPARRRMGGRPRRC